MLCAQAVPYHTRCAAAIHGAAYRQTLSADHWYIMTPFDAHEIATLRQGMDYFRAGDYFAAHDAWEEVWRELHGRRRLFWQAMIQLAVGMHHWENENHKGCRSVWNKALQKCDDLGQQYDTDVPPPLFLLIDLLYTCLLAVEHNEDPTPLLAEFGTSVLSEQWFDVT